MKGNINSQENCVMKRLLYLQIQIGRVLTKKKRKIFHKKYRLAFLSETWVNWCEGLGTVLANDEIKDGLSERGRFSSRTEINETVVS